RGQRAEVDGVIAALMERNAPRAVIDELHARLLMANGQWSEAAASLEKTQSMLTGDANALAQIKVLLGLCHEKRGEPDRALGAYKQALAINPQFTAGHVGAGDALLALGRAEDALEEYRGVLLQVPEVGA